MTANEGKYIYCIIEADKPASFGGIGIGSRNDEVNTVCLKNISAVISDSPIIDYKVSRENLMRHEKVIEEAMKNYTVLPVKFGTISENTDKIKAILTREFDRFSNLIQKMKGKKEVGLKAIFKEDVIFNHIVEKYGEIAKFKEIIASKPPDKTHFQRARIGEMVEKALNNEKEHYKKIILNTLSPLAEDQVINKDYGDRMIINGAFLINIAKESNFDKAVNMLDADHGKIMTFKYVTVVPPFNFVNLVINM